MLSRPEPCLNQALCRGPRKRACPLAEGTCGMLSRPAGTYGAQAPARALKACSGANMLSRPEFVPEPDPRTPGPRKHATRACPLAERRSPEAVGRPVAKKKTKKVSRPARSLLQRLATVHWSARGKGGCTRGLAFFGTFGDLRRRSPRKVKGCRESLSQRANRGGHKLAPLDFLQPNRPLKRCTAGA